MSPMNTSVTTSNYGIVVPYCILIPAIPLLGMPEAAHRYIIRTYITNSPQLTGLVVLVIGDFN